MKLENYEIYTANGQYRKDFIDECINELNIALKLQTIQPLTSCQNFVLHVLENEFTIGSTS